MAKKIGVNEFISKARLIHGDKYCYTVSNLKNFSTKIKIICNDCKSKIGLKNAFFYKRPTDHIAGGQGCPKCAQGKSEYIFGEALSSVFSEYKFKKVRPNFLSFNGNNLELDFYCKSLNLAFEINGCQHYEYVEHFHRNYFNFLSLQCRDEFKRNRCEKKGIRLIEVDLRDFPRGPKRKFMFEDFVKQIKGEVRK